MAHQQPPSAPSPSIEVLRALKQVETETAATLAQVRADAAKRLADVKARAEARLADARVAAERGREQRLKEAALRGETEAAGALAAAETEVRRIGGEVGRSVKTSFDDLLDVILSEFREP